MIIDAHVVVLCNTSPTTTYMPKIEPVDLCALVKEALQHLFNLVSLKLVYISGLAPLNPA